ncbi:hypothetical protein LEMA_P018690.1 [Plenodomus lingam JN3]|uniref:Protein kinase domain-containing protein n=2 Tax=Leptosphaeria maculans TaxID=5022 RepID=E5AAP8_LEPMJ|nr:hypothetical protein LEMA_P018690.1 [Plenodomus lingam JN3]CBY00739.1 hypothetical protein LEMA_P018690.1 [Plenodomus lingam JN3]
MGRPFLSSIPHSSRYMHNLRYRCMIVACILALLQQQYLYTSYRLSLAAKYSPTTFSFDYQATRALLEKPVNQETSFQQNLIAHRALWKVLGKGWEGTVYTYNESVIKTFLPQSPLRNCAPGEDNVKWPTEIPGNLYFGGTGLGNQIEDDSQTTRNRTSDGFLPVEGFFKISTSPSDPPEWHLVTPLLRNGNLNTLAKKLLQEEQSKTVHERDVRFRPAFNQLLVTLDTLHSSGYCHDDIKPDNIFVRDESHWVLGDLGNLRNILHPYHKSRLWKSNQQLADCRANDTIRLLKSYLKFIRSSLDADSFNMELYDGQAPLGRLFWWALADAHTLSAVELQRRSLIENPTSPSENSMNEASFAPAVHQHLWSLIPRRTALRYAADRILMTQMSEKAARWWAMVWLFGVPVPDLCGV